MVKIFAKFILGIASALLYVSAQSSLQDNEAYFAALSELDVAEVKQAIRERVVTSDPGFPADFGSYLGLFVRLAWHCAGTYRVFDGEGGCGGARQRFYPERSWADNTNLDKARGLLEPIKQRFGPGLSYGDLYTLAGTVALEQAGAKTLGICLGRVDAVNGAESVILGPSAEMTETTDCTEANDGNCSEPMGATNMELIYVDAAGFEGSGRPEITYDPIRDTFSRMGMNDDETVALIGGGHSIGKLHGACEAGAGPSPQEQPENPWPGECGTGIGADTYTSGFEGPWTRTPTTFNNEFYRNLLDFNWVSTTGPGGKPEFKSEDAPGLTMLTTDVALIDPDSGYLPIVELFASNESYFQDVWAAAWYKLMTRDMGPRSRCFGDEVPPAQDFQSEIDGDVTAFSSWGSLKDEVNSRLDHANGMDLAAFTTEMAYLCAATYRDTDFFGGCNGARIRLSPEKDWPDRAGIEDLISNWQNDIGKDDLSTADLIVFSGAAALQKLGGSSLDLSFCPGRADASSPSDSAEYLHPYNYPKTWIKLRRESRLFNLGLNKFVALMGRPRSVEYYQGMGYTGVYSNSSTELSTNYFRVLLENTWEVTPGTENLALGAEYTDGNGAYITARDYSLLLDPEMKAAVTTYAYSGDARFYSDFQDAWVSLMNADRFDGPIHNECSNGKIQQVTLASSASEEDDDSLPAYYAFILLAACVAIIAAFLIFGQRK